MPVCALFYCSSVKKNKNLTHLEITASSEGNLRASLPVVKAHICFKALHSYLRVQLYSCGRFIFVDPFKCPRKGFYLI